MNRAAAAVFALVLKFGGAGLLVLGILDSSFLFVPCGNDILLVAMTARNHSILKMLYYATMSTAGSVLGCLLVDITVRPLGSKGLERHLSQRTLDRVAGKVGKNTARAVALASLAPPPFPFTAFVIGAAALQYSRKRLLATVGVARMLRFVLLGMLAWRFGEKILKWAQNSIVQGLMAGLIVVCIAGSAASVYGWIKRSKTARVGQPA